jgi:aryl-alcohol dehydrogenase-like predicted oxidoreductase
VKKRQFGKTGMEITTVGFGAWAIGGGNWEYGWGAQEDADSIAAIHRALDLGVNWIDTAAVYGLGHSEEVVARALHGMSEKPYIFTKCSLVWDKANPGAGISSSMKAASIRAEVEDSLRRLQVEAIDLYQIHWPNPDPEIEEGWSTLAELKKEGKLRHIGVSNFDVSQMERANAIAPVETLQPPYSLVKPEVQDEILPYCERNNIGVIVYSPMYSGMLTGKMTKERVANFPDDDWRGRDGEFKEPRLSRNLALADVMAKIAARHSVPTPAVSVAWTLMNPGVTAAIVGARNAGQVDGFINAGNLTLTDEDIQEIDAFLAANP